MKELLVILCMCLMLLACVGCVSSLQLGPAQYEARSVPEGIWSIGMETTGFTLKAGVDPWKGIEEVVNGVKGLFKTAAPLP